MWVKASGVELADVQPEKGFVAVDYHVIRQGLASCHGETDYTTLVRTSVIPTAATQTGRPSIEAGFHAILGPAVLHSHSILTNLLACSVEGQALCTTILPQAIWVPYASPGLPVTQSVVAQAETGQGAEESAILLLQNHGLVVAAATPDAAWQIHEDVNTTVRRHFGLPDATLDDAPVFLADSAHLLFPDQAVYLGHEILRLSKAGQETQRAYNYLRHTMSMLGLTPNFLPPDEAGFLLNMEAEKYRQKVTKA